jgi:hypothetical protein
VAGRRQADRAKGRRRFWRIDRLAIEAIIKAMEIWNYL